MYVGHCLCLNIVCRSTRQWICCILDMVHILEQTAYLGKLLISVHRYFVLVNTEKITGYRHCVFAPNELRVRLLDTVGTNLTVNYVDRTVVR